MVAQAVGIDDHAHAVFAQVVEVADLYGLSLWCGHALGEQRDGALPVEPVVVVEPHGESQRQVRLSRLQVLEGFLGGLQSDGIGDVQFFHEHPDQVYVVAVGLSLVVEEGVGPQVPCVFIDEGVLLCEYCERVFLGMEAREEE